MATTNSSRAIASNNASKQLALNKQLAKLDRQVDDLQYQIYPRIRT
jgi:hypothetical protein